MLKIYPTQTTKDFEITKQLFVEYVDGLGFDLDFQGFREELENLPGKYVLPESCVLLAKYQENIAGCVAIEKLSDDTCEMKRLYIKPSFRGLKIGKALAEEVIEQARKTGYTHMRLHFIAPRIAETLYRSLGFAEIDPYEDVPIPNAVFMELKLV